MQFSVHEVAIAIMSLKLKIFKPKPAQIRKIIRKQPKQFKGNWVAIFIKIIRTLDTSLGLMILGLDIEAAIWSLAVIHFMLLMIVIA